MTGLEAWVSQMRRREFVTGIAVSTAWPLSSWAQQRNRPPRIGVILNFAETDPVGKLGSLSWRLNSANSDGQTETMSRLRCAGLAFASQFVSQPVDVIIANSTPMVTVL